MPFIAVDASILIRCPLKLAQSSHHYGALFSPFSPGRPVTPCYRKSLKNAGHKLDAFNLSKVSRFPLANWIYWTADGASPAVGVAVLASSSFVDEPTEFIGELNAAGDGINDKDSKKDETGEKSSLPVEGKGMIKFCDKLIEVFMVDKPRPSDWRRLLVFSKEWCKIRPHFFKRCEERAELEDDPGKKQNLLRLGRKLKEIDEDVQRHDELLKTIRAAPSEITEIIAKHRKDFTTEFFEHFCMVAESYYDIIEEQNALVKLRSTCVAAVQAYDNASESIEAINAAQLKLQDALNSPSVEVACTKIDSLAEQNQLDSTMMSMLTNAWSAAKESNLAKDEVKDMLYQLHKTSIGNLQRLMVKEIRIIKYLLTIDDPEERVSALKDAFTPGEELEGKDVDYLYTTPERLFTSIRTVVDAYQVSREDTLLREARDLMNPKIIGRLEELQKIIIDKFM